MGTAPIASKWFCPVFVLCVVAFAAFSQVYLTRQQKQIVRRAKTAGVSLSAEEKKRIEDLDVSKAKLLRGCGLIVLGMLMFTVSAWL